METDAMNSDGYVYLLNAAAERGATERELQVLGAELMAEENDLLVARAA